LTQNHAFNKASVFYNKKSLELSKNCRQADKQMAQMSMFRDHLMHPLEWVKGDILHMVAVLQPGEAVQLHSEVVLVVVQRRLMVEELRNMAQQHRMGKADGEGMPFAPDPVLLVHYT
jgi:hypothetical protein